MSVRGSPPASSRSTRKPVSASLAASVPPPAPEPTMMKSASYWAGRGVMSGLEGAPSVGPGAKCGVSQRRRAAPERRSLHCFEEPDQIALLIVAQTRFVGQQVGAEIVALVDDVVGALAHPEDR